MLPSIKFPPNSTSGNPVTSYRRRTTSKEKGASNIVDAKGKEVSNESPLLPLISEGSFTSLVSSKSSKSKWREKIKQSNGAEQNKKTRRRGGGFKEYPSSMNTVQELSNSGERNSGVKTTRLHLNYDFGSMIDKGWTPQNQNPRITKLQNVTGRFQAAQINYVNFPSYTEYTRSVAAPHVEFLYHRKQRKARERAAKHDGRTGITTNGVPADVTDRYRVPPLGLAITEPAPPPHTDPLPPPVPLVTDTLSRDTTESCIHKRTCGFGQGHRTERQTPKVSSRQNSWDRGPASPLKRFSLQSNGSSTARDLHRLRPATDKPPPVSPPKIPQNRRGVTLSRLRRKAKKSQPTLDTDEKLIEKRRKSSVSSPNHFKQPPRKQETKAKTSLINEANDKEDSAKGRGDYKDEEMPSQGEEAAENEQGPPRNETPPIEMDIGEDNAQSSEKDWDARTVVESVVSTATTPRRMATPKLLKINPKYFQESSELALLQKMFTKLDGDGDGHLTFPELQRNLPSDLTKRQTSYIKKIYQLACESTYFGLEEFVAVHQMCQIMSQVGYSVFQAYDTTDTSQMEESISLYMDLFHSLDKKQSGSVSLDSFKQLLSSALEVSSDCHKLQTILDVMRKGNGDCVSSVELLAFLPFILSSNRSSLR